MMLIPDRIEIIGHDITIIKQNEIKIDDQDESGIASFSDDVMLLAERCHDLPLSKDMKNETLLHESLHFIDDAMNIGLTEDQVQRIARGIYALIRNNKLNFLE